VGAVAACGSTATHTRTFPRAGNFVCGFVCGQLEAVDEAQIP